MFSHPRVIAKYRDGAYETKGTNFGSKCRGGTYFTTRSPQVDDLDFIGVLESAQVGEQVAESLAGLPRTSLGAMADLEEEGRDGDEDTQNDRLDRFSLAPARILWNKVWARRRCYTVRVWLQVP